MNKLVRNKILKDILKETVIGDPYKDFIRYCGCSGVYPNNTIDRLLDGEKKIVSFWMGFEPYVKGVFGLTEEEYQEILPLYLKGVRVLIDQYDKTKETI